MTAKMDWAFLVKFQWCSATWTSEFNNFHISNHPFKNNMAHNI